MLDAPALFTSYTEASAELFGILCLTFFGLRVSILTLQAMTSTPGRTAMTTVRAEFARSAELADLESPAVR